MFDEDIRLETTPDHDDAWTDSLADEDDAPREECGVFGIYAPGEDVARLTYFGLFALQHRGQESAGIMVSDGREIKWYKEMGLVTQVFDERTLSQLKGDLAIGHTRYSTTGSSVLRNAQPLHCAWGRRHGRRRPQRQPHQHGRAAGRDGGAGRPFRDLQRQRGDRPDDRHPAGQDAGRRRRPHHDPPARGLFRRHPDREMP